MDGKTKEVFKVLTTMPQASADDLARALGVSGPDLKGLAGLCNRRRA